MANDVYQEFEWRGMVYEGTEGVRDVLAREKVTCYIGFDPTASSLHVGSLLVDPGARPPAALRPHADRHRRRRHRA